MTKKERLQQLLYSEEPAVRKVYLQPQIIQGEQGPQGEIGPQGPQGIQGIQGPIGPEGKIGVPGIPGTNGRDGKDGYTPIRGFDYWTLEDRNTIITDVISRVPKAKDGVSPDVSKIISSVKDALKKEPLHLKDINGTKELIEFLKRGGFRGGGSSGGISNITGLITPGTNVTITGSGTLADPYIINSSGSGGGIAIGDLITGADPNRVLFTDGIGDLTQATNFQFNGSTMTIGNDPDFVTLNLTGSLSITGGGSFSGQVDADSMIANIGSFTSHLTTNDLRLGNLAGNQILYIQDDPDLHVIGSNNFTFDGTRVKLTGTGYLLNLDNGTTSVNLFKYDTDYVLSIGNTADYPDMPRQLKLNYKRDGVGYQYAGLKLFDFAAGYETIINQVAAGKLYWVDGTGAAGTLVIGTIENPFDGTKNFQATGAGWTVNGAIAVESTTPVFAIKDTTIGNVHQYNWEVGGGHFAYGQVGLYDVTVGAVRFAINSSGQWSVPAYATGSGNPEQLFSVDANGVLHAYSNLSFDANTNALKISGTIESTGNVTIDTLATGGVDEMVTVDTNGLLSSAPIPSGGSPTVEVLDTITVTSGATIDIDLTSYSAYSKLVIDFDVLPATNGVDFCARISTDGTTFLTASNYEMSFLYVFGGGAGGSTNTAQDHWVVMDGLPNTAGNRNMGTITIVNPFEASLKACAWYHATRDGTVSLAGGVQYNANTIWGGVRFYFSSGNFARGFIKITGYKD